MYLSREKHLFGEVCAAPRDEPVCLGQRMMLYRPRSDALLSRVSAFMLSRAKE